VSASPDAAAPQMAKQRRPRRHPLRDPRYLKARRIINSERAALVFTGVLAFILILQGLPRFFAEAVSVGAQTTMNQLRDGKKVSDSDLADAAKELDLANIFDPHNAERLTDLALIHLRNAQHQGLETESGKNELQTSMKLAERGLEQNPANTYAWLRLAEARLERDGGLPSPGVLRALRMSYRTGPYVDQLMPARAQMSLRLWERLDEELQTYASHELAYLWTDGVWAHQKQIIDSVCLNNRAFILAHALRESTAGTTEFDRLYPDFMTPEACRDNASLEKQAPQR